MVPLFIIVEGYSTFCLRLFLQKNNFYLLGNLIYPKKPVSLLDTGFLNKLMKQIFYSPNQPLIISSFSDIHLRPASTGSIPSLM